MQADASARGVARAVDQLVRSFESHVGGQDTLPARLTRVLERLDGGGPATTSELAAAAGVRHQSMAATVADLERLGFAARRPHPEDVRKVLVEITDDGRDGLGEHRRSRLNWLVTAIERGMGEAARADAAAALANLLDVIEADFPR